MQTTDSHSDSSGATRAPEPARAARSPLDFAKRVMAVATQRLRARWHLRACNSVGSDVELKGRLRLENLGQVRIGRRASFTSTFVPIEILTSPTGCISIGDGVWINFGVVVAAHSSVSIGDRAMIGQHCIISDVDFPEVEPIPDGAAPRPIVIGASVWLAGRVTVRPGVTIGDRAVVIAGSIVEDDLPSDTICGGIPARPLMRVKQSTATSPAATKPS